MTAIKICGIRRAEDIDAANELQPEYIGFVFAQESRRYLPPECAAQLHGRLHPGIQAVGVFVNEPLENIIRLLEDGVINLVQLHGTEDEAYIAQLRQQTGKPVIQAFRIRSAEDIHRAAVSPADMILLDAGAGDGRAFDWDLPRGLQRPYFLAGGLNPHNVAQAIQHLRPFGVDVSSGIETDGMKDIHKMRAFIGAVRGAMIL